MLRKYIIRIETYVNSIRYQWVALFAFFIVSFSVLGQTQSMENSEIDSLNKVTSPFNPDNEHIGVSHYERLLKNAKANKYDSGIIDSYYNLAQYYYYNDKKIDSMLYFYDQTIFLINSTGISEKILPRLYSEKAINLALSGMEFLSLEYFEKAYEVALEASDEYEIIRSQINLAGFNMKLKNYEKAINLVSAILEDSASITDSIKYQTLYDIMGASLIETGKIKEGLEFLEKSYAIAKKNNWEEQMYETGAWIAKAYAAQGNSKKAILICENINTEFAEFPGKKKLTSIILGQALIQDSQPLKAIKVLEEGLKLDGTQEEQITILEKLSFTYLSQKKNQKARPLITEAIHLRDSIQDSRAKSFSRYSTISYNLLETELKNTNLAHDNEVLETKAVEREYILSVLVLSITVILLSVLGYMLAKKYRSGKKVIKTLKANEKEILEAHIKQREDELGVTMAHLSESMKTLKTITTELDKSISNKDFTALKNIKNALKEHQRSSSATALLTDRMESQYPRMTAQLLDMYPNFSPNDIKHCLIIKLGLSLKDTAQLFNITVAAVKSARGRMRKKMDLDKSVSLRQHLSFVAKSA